MTALYKVHQGGTRTRIKERKRTFLFTPCDCGLMMVMMMKTCCSKLAVLPTLHSAVMIIIGAHTELCLTAATSLLLPLVPCDHTERSHARKYASSLHHLHRSTGFYLEGFLCSHSQTACRACVKLRLLYIYSIYTTECICSEYIHDKNKFSTCAFTNRSCWIYLKM